VTQDQTRLHPLRLKRMIVLHITYCNSLIRLCSHSWIIYLSVWMMMLKQVHHPCLCIAVPYTRLALTGHQRHHLMRLVDLDFSATPSRPPMLASFGLTPFMNILFRTFFNVHAPGVFHTSLPVAFIMISCALGTQFPAKYVHAGALGHTTRTIRYLRSTYRASPSALDLHALFVVTFVVPLSTGLTRLQGEGVTHNTAIKAPKQGERTVMRDKHIAEAKMLAITLLNLF
jgi:hypothetical protein